MTRNEFLENVTDFCDLKEFCSNYGCYLLEDVYDEESRDAFINECLTEWAREDDWQGMLARLNDIPTGYDWYYNDDCGEWYGLDDNDFENYKDDVIRWGDDEEVWDEEDEDCDDSTEEQTNEDDEPAPEAEDFSVCDLVGMCFLTYHTIQDNAAHQAKEEEDAFRHLYPKVLK